MRSTTTSTGRAIGGCSNCGAGNAVDLDSIETSGRVPVAGLHSTCQNCGRSVTLKYVYGDKSDQPCDGACMSAIGPNCSCSCGGANHGRWNLAIELVPVWEAEQARTARAKRIVDHTKRAEAKVVKARKTAEDRRATLLAAQPNLVWLTYLDNLHYDLYDRFLIDMRTAFNRGEMSDRQITAAVDAIERSFHRYETELAREAATAQLAAAGVRVPTGRQTITGTVAATREYDNGWRGVTHKMLVVTDEGWKVWGTIPRTLMDEVQTATRNDRQTWGEQYSAAHQLRNRTVTFTATLAGPKADDPLFGYFDRPAAAHIVKDDR